MIVDVGMVGGVLPCLDLEFGGRHSSSEDTLGIDAPVLLRQAAERRSEVLDRQPQIEQPADDHVAGYTGETVEIQRLRQPSDLLILSKTVVLHVCKHDVIEHVDSH